MATGDQRNEHGKARDECNGRRRGERLAAGCLAGGGVHDAQQSRPAGRKEVPVETCTDRASLRAGARRTVAEVDNRAEVREFLVSRRANLTPQHAGLASHGRRRVPGLRRSEVAALAGVSVEYYSKLERGSLGGASAGVLDAIARAFQLDQAEREHLFHLAQAADGSSAIMRPQRRATKPWSARPSLQWTLDAITDAPTIVGNDRLDLLAANHLGRALYATTTATRRHPRTSRASPSSTAPRTASTRTGSARPTPPSPTCEPPPAEIPTTRRCTTSSAN